MSLLQSIEEYRECFYQGTVPPLIHQTWKNDTIPDKWLPSKEHWVKFHPNWIYTLWTDEMNRELIKRHYHWFLDKYDSYPYGIQRADAARPFILHRYGGIYSDLDIQPNRSLSRLLMGKTGVLLLNNNGRYTNMIMASNRGSPFWLEVINEMMSPTVPWWAGTRHFYIQCTTGPFVIDRVARKHNGIVGHLPSDLIQPCSICDPKPCTEKGSYITMLKGSSWSQLDSEVITWCSCNYHLIALTALVVMLVAITWHYT